MAPPINDDFANAQEVLDGILEDEGIAGTIVDATDEADWETIAAYGPPGDVPFVWYHFQTPAEDTQIYWKITKTGGDAGFSPYTELYSGSAPADYNDLVFLDSIGDGTATPPASRFVPLAASTDHWILVTNWDADGTEGDFELDLQLVPSYLREEWDEPDLDPAIWRMGTAFPDADPNTGDWSIVTTPFFSGASAVKLAPAGFTNEHLNYRDQIGGNQDDVEYWIAYKFYVPDWEPYWDWGSFVYLPDWSLGTNSASGLAYWGLEADSASTGGIWTISDGGFDYLPITPGAWHELRISFRRASVGGHGFINEILDGVQISTDYDDGAYGTGARPGGVAWRNASFNGNGEIVYLDPLIYSPGADPGEITPFCPDDAICVPLIDATTSVLAPIFDVDLPVPFIGPTTTVFDPYLMGDVFLDAPFIGPTTIVYAPALLGPLRARVSQLPVEVVYAGDPMARLSQLPVEVVRVGDPMARLSQMVVEVVVQNTREDINLAVIVFRPRGAE